MTEKLAKLLVASKLLDCPWNGTDLQEVLRFQAGQVLLSLRTFISTGFLLEMEPFAADSHSPSSLLTKFIAKEVLLFFIYWLKEITDIVAFIGKYVSGKPAPEVVKQKILLAGMHCGRLTYIAELLCEEFQSTKDVRLKSNVLKSKLSDLTLILTSLYPAIKSHVDQTAVFEYSAALMDTTDEIVYLFKNDIFWTRSLEALFLGDDETHISANEFTSSQDSMYRKYKEEFGLGTLSQQGQGQKILEALNSLDRAKHESLLFASADRETVSNIAVSTLHTAEKKLPMRPNDNALLRLSTQYVLVENPDDTLLKAFLLSFHEMGSSLQLLSELKQILNDASKNQHLIKS